MLSEAMGGDRRKYQCFPPMIRLRRRSSACTAKLGATINQDDITHIEISWRISWADFGNDEPAVITRAVFLK